MTPVDATITSVFATPVCVSTRADILSAISMPSALQVLALPLLQITACAFPSAIWALVTVRGAPFTRLVV